MCRRQRTLFNCPGGCCCEACSGGSTRGWRTTSPPSSDYGCWGDGPPAATQRSSARPFPSPAAAAGICVKPKPQKTAGARDSGRFSSWNFGVWFRVKGLGFSVNCFHIVRM
ncbi:unnamed protein product [Symbiodinium sp. KB8]|nr:unnamed protein product [Symbiodinium sp. KB8]